MGHRGGYAYRLCKVKNGKPWKVTEKCFQNGHLNFHGNTTWIYDKPFPGEWNPENWSAQPKKTTTIGTTPPGKDINRKISSYTSVVHKSQGASL